MSETAKPASVEDGGLRAPLLINAREAARLLGLSERTLWSMTASGEIPHVRIRRSVRYSPHDLAAWIAAKTRKVRH